MALNKSFSIDLEQPGTQHQIDCVNPELFKLIGQIADNLSNESHSQFQNNSQQNQIQSTLSINIPTAIASTFNNFDAFELHSNISQLRLYDFSSDDDDDNTLFEFNTVPKTSKIMLLEDLTLQSKQHQMLFSTPKPLVFNQPKSDTLEKDKLDSIKSKFANRSNHNVSILNTAQQNEIILSKYRNYQNDIDNLKREQYEFYRIIDNYPIQFQSNAEFKNSLQLKIDVLSEMQKFNDQIYLKPGEIETAFNRIYELTIKIASIKPQLEKTIAIFNEQKRIEMVKQQEMQMQAEKQAQLNKIQTQPLPKFSIDFNLAKLMSRTKPANSFTQQKIPQQNDSDSNVLLFNLLEIENKRRKWESEWDKQKLLNFKRLINTTVNSISAKDVQKLMQKASLFDDLLSGKQVKALNLMIQVISQDEKTYCGWLIADRLIKKGETEVASTISAAYPIATIIICLSSRHKDFANIMLALFYHSCPVTIPNLPKIENSLIESEEFKMKLGYKKNKENLLETDDEFNNRIKGLLRLYCCVMQFSIEGMSKLFNVKSHFYGIERAWSWLHKLINTDLLISGVTDAAVQIGLEIMGHKLNQVYTNEFNNLFQIISSAFLEKMRKSTLPRNMGTFSRLETFIGEHKRKLIPEPEGAFKRDFWTQVNVFSF